MIQPGRQHRAFPRRLLRGPETLRRSLRWRPPIALLLPLVVGSTFAAPARAQVASLRLAPGSAAAAPGQLVDVTVMISVPEAEITAVQFVLGFDAAVAVFRSARIGDSLAGLGFDVWDVNATLQSAPECADAGVLVQLFGGAARSFTGRDLRAVVLTFALADTTCRVSPLCFDTACANTRLVTTQLGTICAPSLALESGHLSTRCTPATPICTTKDALTLWQNVPNPCSDGATIAFNTPHPGRVQLLILTATGRLVRLLQDSVLPDGTHEVRWNGLDARGRPVPAGVYYYQVATPETRVTRRLQLLR